MLPLVAFAVNRLSFGKSLLLFITLSIAVEVTSNIAGVPDYLYRLLSYRYLFVIYLGCAVKKFNLTLNFKTLIAALIAACFLMIMENTSIDLHPLFSNQWGI